MQTWHLLIVRRCSCPSFRITESGGDANCISGFTVVNQKLYLLAKNWHVPRWPWHSMKGADRKFSRQLPVDMRDCPPPWSPDPVCWKKHRREALWYRTYHLLIFNQMLSLIEFNRPYCKVSVHRISSLSYTLSYLLARVRKCNFPTVTECNFLTIIFSDLA